MLRSALVASRVLPRPAVLSRGLKGLAVDPFLEYAFPEVTFTQKRRNSRPRPPRDPAQPRINRKKLYSVIPAPEADAHLYQLKAGIVVERPPRLLPDKEPWEVAMEKMQSERKLNPRRAKNAFRLPPGWAERFELRELRLEELQRQGSALDEATMEAVNDIVVLPDDQFEAELARLRAWKASLPPPSKQTADDATDNRHSLNRKLQTSLFLLIKKDRPQHAWQFPQGHIERGESLRAAGERELQEEVGSESSLWTHFLGNAPIGYYKYHYPTQAQTKDAKGAKVFFLHTLYMAGEVKLNREEGLVDYAWVTKDELPEYITDPALLDKAKRFLLAQGSE